MAKQETHFSTSVMLGIAYGAAGIVLFQIYPEHVLLASAVVIVAGILPNIDADPGAGQAREIGGLLAAVIPLVIVELFPSVKAGGIPRIALIVICCYALSRMFFVRFFEHWTTHRGMIHSIPAALITFELVYLLFWDLYLKERMFIAAGAFVGFLSHLLIDAYGNIDFSSAGSKKIPALKFRGQSWESTCAAYSCVIFLGWFVFRDAFPHLHQLSGKY